MLDCDIRMYASKSANAPRTLTRRRTARRRRVRGHEGGRGPVLAVSPPPGASWRPGGHDGLTAMRPERQASPPASGCRMRHASRGPRWPPSLCLQRANHRLVGDRKLAEAGGAGHLLPALELRMDRPLGEPSVMSSSLRPWRLRPGWSPGASSILPSQGPRRRGRDRAPGRPASEGLVPARRVCFARTRPRVRTPRTEVPMDRVVARRALTLYDPGG
jgi:hypothetical protein